MQIINDFYLSSLIKMSMEENATDIPNELSVGRSTYWMVSVL